MTGRAKNIAGVSLGVMAAGFAATLPFPGGVAIPLLQSGFEAGLVGGLADWFAVTALFRHPMGIPIPHTAIMTKNRVKVTNALVAVIENDLLNKETINEKISQNLRVEKMVQGLEKGIHTEPYKQGLVAISQFILENIPVQKIASVLANEVSHHIRSLDTESIIKTIMKEALHRGYEEKAFDFILEKTKEIISRDEIRDQIGSMGLKAFEKLQLGGLMQFAVNAFMGYLSEEKLGDILQGFILNGIRDLSDRNHPTRAMLLDEIRIALKQAGGQAKLLGEIEAWKEQLLNDWDVEGKISGWLEVIRLKALVFIHEDRYKEEVMVTFITQAIDRIKAQPDWIASFEGWIQQQVYHFVEENHQKIGKLVRENVDKLDNETLIALMEDKLGKDLQWIRVNGAVCGFLIGLLLGGIKLLTS